jgi:hypothetical protein
MQQNELKYHREDQLVPGFVALGLWPRTNARYAGFWVRLFARTPWRNPRCVWSPCVFGDWSGGHSQRQIQVGNSGPGSQSDYVCFVGRCCFARGLWVVATHQNGLPSMPGRIVTYCSARCVFKNVRSFGISISAAFHISRRSMPR